MDRGPRGRRRERAASSTPDGPVKDKPVTSADLFATIYTALGMNPRVKHFVGTRPIWATPEDSTVVRDLLA